MMTSTGSRVNFNDVLGKLDEMRAVFLIGSRSLPMLEDLLRFVREISPLLDEISRSLSFTTSKMPSAASQLERVTQATELATTEILDLVDQVLGEVQTARAEVAAEDVCRQALAERDARFLANLGDAASSSPVRAALATWKAEGEAVLASWQAHHVAQVNVLNSVRDHMNRIMMALQVQDITAQQLASVNHLIEGVRVRMAEIFERLTHDVEVSHDDLTGLRASQSRFDPTACYTPHGDHQHRADRVMEIYAAGDGAVLDTMPDPVCAADGDVCAPEPASAPEEPGAPGSCDDSGVLFASTPPDAAPTEPAGDGIDARFGRPPESGPASQDDIDALFG